MVKNLDRSFFRLAQSTRSTNGRTSAKRFDLFADAYFWSSENIRYKSVMYFLTCLLTYLQTDGRTDGRTDGQTDSFLIAIPRLQSMQCGKNNPEYCAQCVCVR